MTITQYFSDSTWPDQSYRTSATPCRDSALDSLSSSSAIVSQPPQVRWLDDLFSRILHEALRCREDGADFMELLSTGVDDKLVVFFSGQLSDRCLLASRRVLTNIEAREREFSRGRVLELVRLWTVLLFGVMLSEVMARALSSMVVA